MAYRTPQQQFGISDAEAEKLPLGLRKSNNVFNVKYFRGAERNQQAWPGLLGPSEARDQGDPQMKFATIDDSGVAGARLLQRKYASGMLTPSQLVAGPKGWTPGFQGAADNVSRLAGIKSNQDARLDTPEGLRRFMPALAAQEHGEGTANKYLTPDTWDRIAEKATGAQFASGQLPQLGLLKPDGSNAHRWGEPVGTANPTMVPRADGPIGASAMPPPMKLGGPSMAGSGMLGTWTPDEVNARRRMAGGMIQEGMSSAPVQHWTQGLARVLGGLSGNMWMDQANKAQREGMAAGAQTMQDAINGGDPKAAIGGMLANPWTQDQGQKLATGMLANEIQSQTPDAKLARDAKQFDLDNKRRNAPLDRDLKEAQIAKLKREAETGDNPAAVREWQFFSRLDPAAQERYLTMKRSDKYLDTGTAFVRPSQVDPTAPPVANITKDVAGAAAQREIGERQGQAAADLPRQVDNAALALDTINQIRSHPGKRYGVGTLGVLPGIPGTDQKGFVALVDQLKGKTFLEAFNSLKGGGQITEAEGRKATEALARLDRGQKPEDFDKALSDLETVIQLGIQRSRKATGGRTTTGGQGGGGGAPSPVPSGNYVFDPATGQLRPR